MSKAIPLSPEARHGGRPAATAVVHRRDQERVQIRAAQLRVTTDKKLGRQTPDWVKELAKKPL